MKHFIRIKGVSKYFGDFAAVDNVDSKCRRPEQ